MEKEIRNVFFGKIAGAEAEYTDRVIHPYKYTVILQDNGMCIELVFRGTAGGLIVPSMLKMNDPVQVTQWSDNTVTIEPFNEN